jgi:transposase InsO family protein
MERIIRPKHERLQQVWHHLAVMMAVGAPHNTMHIIPVGWTFRPRFVDQTVQGFFSNDREHHRADGAVWLGDGRFRQLIKECGLAVDVADILQQFFDDFLLATDFFTAEVWTLGGLVTYYVLFFIHLGSRKVYIAGMTPQPNQAWMMQVARNVTMEQWGFLSPGQYLIHDRDGKYGPAFRQLIDAAGVTRVPLPPRSPNLNAYAERWVRSVKEECLSRLILYGEASLRHALTQYVEHFHHERNHQGKGNVRLFPAIGQDSACQGPIQCRERLGGLLKYYAREAA